MKHLVALLAANSLFAAGALPAGTWVRRDDPKSPAHLTLKVEEVAAGLKLTYTATGPASGDQIMTLVTHLDGKDAPAFMGTVATGSSMAIRAVDNRHTTAVVKFRGKQMNTSTTELSPDGKVLKVQNTSAGPDGKPAVSTEYWDKR